MHGDHCLDGLRGAHSNRNNLRMLGDQAFLRLGRFVCAVRGNNGATGFMRRGTCATAAIQIDSLKRESRCLTQTQRKTLVEPHFQKTDDVSMHHSDTVMRRPQSHVGKPLQHGE